MPDTLSAAGRGETVGQRWRQLGRFLDAQALRQHRDPIAFYAEAAAGGVWPLFRPYRLGLVLAVCAGLLAAMRWFTGPIARLWLLAAPLLCVAFLLLCLALSTLAAPPGERTTTWLAFWVVYLSSLPVLIVIVLCALLGAVPLAGGVGWIVGMPLVVGVFVADVCTVSVHPWAARTDRRRARQRAGGLPADLPQLRTRRLTRRVRTVLAAGLVLGGAGLAGFGPGLERLLGVALCCGAFGVLRLEASLLGWLGIPLLTAADHDNGRWRIGYVGRNARYLPTGPVARTLQAISTDAERAAAVLVLLQDGDGGASAGRALGRLPVEEGQRLLVHLSLEEGGADALDFLARSLSSALQPLAGRYAALAAEAARPPDLQRWLETLCLPVFVHRLGLETADEPILAAVRVALLLVQDDPAIDHAITALRRFAQELAQARHPHAEHGLPTGAWPLTLLARLELHRQRLRPPPHPWRCNR